MKELKPIIKTVNLKLSKETHQRLLEEKAKTYKSINLLIEEAIKSKYK